MVNSFIFWGGFIGLILLALFLQKRKNDKWEKARREVIDDVFNMWKNAFKIKGYEFPSVDKVYIAKKGDLGLSYKSNRTAEAEDYQAYFNRIFEQLDRKNNFIQKYGEEQYNRLTNETYYIGMSKNELIDFLGETKDIRIAEFKNKIRETLVYGLHNFVFDDGILVTYRKNKN